MYISLSYPGLVVDSENFGVFVIGLMKMTKKIWDFFADWMRKNTKIKFWFENTDLDRFYVALGAAVEQ